MSGDGGGLTPGMRRAVAAVTVLVALGLVAALALWFLAGPGSPATRADATGRATTAAPTAASEPASHAPEATASEPENSAAAAAASSASEENVPGTLPKREVDPNAPVDPKASSSTIAAPKGSAGPAEDAKPSAGSEARPDAPSASTLPKVKQPKRLLTSPPKSSSKTGALTKGFPRQLMGPVSGSAVSSSSVTSQGHRTQVALAAHTSASAKSVRAHYQKLWSGLGLAPTTSADGTLTYTSASGSVTLSFPESATDTRYSVYGTFTTK